MPDLCAVRHAQIEREQAGLSRDDALQDFGVFETVVDLHCRGEGRGAHGEQQYGYPGGEGGSLRRGGEQRLGALGDV